MLFHGRREDSMPPRESEPGAIEYHPWGGAVATDAWMARWTASDRAGASPVCATPWR
jgi:hypothetical protein